MKHCLTILLLCFCAGGLRVGAQTNVELKQLGGECKIENGLPVSIMAFIVARDQEGQFLSATSVSVPAASAPAVPCLHGYVVRIEDWELIHLGVARQKLPSIFTRRLSKTIADSDPARVKQQLKTLEVSESGVGSEKIALAAAQAQLWLEQRNDEREVFRHDPLRDELERQAAALDSTSAGSLRRVQVQNERSRNAVIEDVGDMAMAYSMAAEARLDVIEREKDLYEPLYRNAKQALVFLHRDAKNFDAEVRAGSAFLTNTAKALAALPADDYATEQFRVIEGPRRIDDTPSGLKEIVQIEASGAKSLSVLLADVTFDHGGGQQTFFRRMSGTNRWVARIYWPIFASSAQVSVRSPGQPQSLKLGGLVLPGRPAMSASFQLAEKSMNAVIKKYKETSFRAEGADSIKTTPIP